jgi:hypothetical protein
MTLESTMATDYRSSATLKGTLNEVAFGNISFREKDFS